MDDNSIENALNAIQPPSDDGQQALIMAAVKAIGDKNKSLEKFLSPEDLMTQITPSERKLIPLLQYTAVNPFPRLLDWSKEHNPPKIHAKIVSEMHSKSLDNFLSKYLKYGLAVSRTGRKEDLEALKQYLAESTDMMMPDTSRGGLL